MPACVWGGMVWPASLYVTVLNHGLHGLGGTHGGQHLVTAGSVPGLHTG